MTVRYVIDSSDNNYVQYRLLSDTFNTNIKNWQGVVDEPDPSSNDIISSKGAANSYGYYKYNPEFLEAHTDRDDVYLYGVKRNGDFDWNSGIPKHLDDYIHKYGNSEKIIEEDYLAMTVDKDDNVVNIRKKDGKLVELLGIESPEIASEHFVFKQNALRQLEEDLRNDGFKPGAKDLNILFIGSSSEQDYVAYVPPILEEVLYDYNVIIGDMYVSGGSANDYVDLYKQNKGCTTYNEWTATTKKWIRYKNNELLEKYTIETILNKFRWDLIIFKGSTESSRNLMRIIQDVLNTSELITNGSYPVAFATDAMVPRPGYSDGWSWSTFINSAKEHVKNTGFVDYIPIATAI